MEFSMNFFKMKNDGLTCLVFNILPSGI